MTLEWKISLFSCFDIVDLCEYDNDTAFFPIIKNEPVGGIQVQKRNAKMIVLMKKWDMMMSLLFLLFDLLFDI